MDGIRQTAVSREGVQHFFNNLEAEIKEHDIKAQNIYNFDEKGFLIGIGKRARVIATAAEQPNKNKRRQDGNRESVTIIVAISADGSHFSPTIIYKGLPHQEDWYNEVSADDNMLLGHSEKGWTNNKLGRQWLDQFHRHTEEKAAGAYV